MLNKIFLQGRLVADPELRHTQSGIAVASFRIAVDRDFKDRETGEKKADFINVVAWRNTAEFVSRFFSKGRMAIVDGKLQVREYTDRDGNRRYATEVVADNIYFGDSKRDNDGYAPQGGYGQPAGGYNDQPVVRGYSQPAAGYNGQPGGDYSAPSAGSYAPQTGDGYPTAPAVNQFADLNDDDGELPF